MLLLSQLFLQENSNDLISFTRLRQYGTKKIKEAKKENLQKQRKLQICTIIDMHNDCYLLLLMRGLIVFGIVMAMINSNLMDCLSMDALMGTCSFRHSICIIIIYDFCTCSYSRKILWLEIADSTSNPMYIAHYFLRCVENVGGKMKSRHPN